MCKHRWGRYSGKSMRHSPNPCNPFLPSLHCLICHKTRLTCTSCQTVFGSTRHFCQVAAKHWGSVRDSSLELPIAVIKSDEIAKNLVEEMAGLKGLLCNTITAFHGIFSLQRCPRTRRSCFRVRRCLHPLKHLQLPEHKLMFFVLFCLGQRPPRKFKDAQFEARARGTKAQSGKLMTIASIKFLELAKRLQKMKGGIVYRGDCAKGKDGAAAANWVPTPHLYKG